MLTDPLFRHAAERPGAPAVADERQQMSYRDLATAALGVSAMVCRATDKPRVGLLLPSSTAFAAAFYGILSAGKAAVPINFLLGEREVGHVIADSGIDLVLSAPPLIDKLRGINGLTLIDLTNPPETPAGPESPATPPKPVENGPDDLAVLLYTSGTSGLPKGVCLTHGNLDSDVHAAIEHYVLDRTHHFLGVIPLFHSTGLLACLIAPVTLGAEAVYIARFSPVATAKAIAEHKISVMAAVPSMYGAIARLKDFGPAEFASLYAPLSGGEPLPTAIREGFLQKFNVPLMEGYGLTETCGPIAVNTPQHHKPGSVGRLLPGAEAKIIDDDGGETSREEPGEICFRGPMVFAAYHNHPDATASAFTDDGFFKTGDLGYMDGAGYLHVTGRKKELIIVAGEKVPPREIEEVLARHPDVADAAVVGKPDPSRGETVAAFVVMAEGKSCEEKALREFCRQQGMANWKVPRDVVFVDELPRSPTGKVLKRELVDRLSAAD